MASSSASVRSPFCCPVCDVAFSTIISSERAPAYMRGCGHTMCVGCVKETREDSEDTTSPFRYLTTCVICDKVSKSVNRDPQRLKSLIGIQREIEVKLRSAKPSFITNVDVEIHTDELSSLTCPGCDESYTADAHTSTAYTFMCGHMCCVDCAQQNLRKKSTKDRAILHPDFPLIIECFECREDTHRQKEIKRVDGVIKDVINWLEQKNRKQVESMPQNLFSCLDCKEMTPCDQGHVCTDCTPEDKSYENSCFDGNHVVLCAHCVLTGHSEHAHEEFLPIKLGSLFRGVCSDTHDQVNVGSYDEAREAGIKNVELLKEAKECFSTATQTIRVAAKCSEATVVVRNLKRKAEVFEATLESIERKTRRNNETLQEMIDDLKKTFPVGDTESNKGENEGDGESQREPDSGDSEGEEETDDGPRTEKRRRLGDSATDV